MLSEKLKTRIMDKPLRIIVDALVITAVAALGLGFAVSTDWPRWFSIITFLPAAYLVSRFSGDTTLPWWKTMGFVCVLIFIGFLEDGVEVLPRGFSLPIFIIVGLNYHRLKRNFVR